MFSRIASGFVRASARRFSTATSRGAVAAALPLRWKSVAAVSGAVAAAAAAVSCRDEAKQQAVPLQGIPGTNHERTFIAVKPDGVQRNLVGEIIARFEKRGYKLVALKMVWVPRQFAEKHYQDLSKKPFYSGLCDYFSSGPVVAMIWEGKDAIATGRSMLGATNPLQSAPGTIRGDYCINLGRNVCHGSDAPDSAQKEIALWFQESEVLNWNQCQQSWVNE